MKIPKGRLGDILYDNTSPIPPEDQTVSDVLKALQEKPKFRIKNFYYRKENWKGYIPNDKVRIADEPYETGWWNEVIGTDIEKEHLDMLLNYKNGFDSLLKKIDKRIDEFLESKNLVLENPKVRPFYLNFNHDGIDCFVHRWNLKYKK